MEFDDMIADMLSKKKRNPIVTKLFIRGRKLNISFLFITQLIMTIDANIREELQYDSNKEAAKISAFSSGKVDNYEYLLLQAKTYYLLIKVE